ncbi:T3SS effector HopA1 family protein [Aliirhizobium cellulosilyticum]|uniref:Uncharacterized protein n=1 Tax=Aliirhizobium cellulosilyticum TaxID=393664 RepID=A0A7W6X9P8_9HYPH|nr:T3SS effector HopA1 family protein [Rhizobium cellulosilyticum]MBB4348586.1 hypothetical protein [Rhizobium cellulosilyticum]MBB4411822.1 hypothetical protein [Rhizobium cellulosilyticum]MBB4446513.1 hypothetical protein [Rhizobium cellulosilyticum]
MLTLFQLLEQIQPSTEGILTLPAALVEDGQQIRFNAEQERGPLIRQLYSLYHLRVREIATLTVPDIFNGASSSADAHLTRAFSKLFRGRFYESLGWKRQTCENDGVGGHFTRAGVSLHCSAAQIRRMEDDLHHTLLFPCLQTGARPGFFVMHSSHGPANPVQFRVYLNLESSRSITSLYYIWQALDARSMKFSIKVVSSAYRLGRSDSAVIYIAADGLRSCLRELRNLRFDRHFPRLVASTSLFARRVSDGIAVAEEPERRTGDALLSFGQHRASMLAAAIIAARTSGWSTDALIFALRMEGMDPRRAYRNQRVGWIANG